MAGRSRYRSASTILLAVVLALLLTSVFGPSETVLQFVTATLLTVILVPVASQVQDWV